MSNRNRNTKNTINKSNKNKDDEKIMARIVFSLFLDTLSVPQLEKNGERITSRTGRDSPSTNDSTITVSVPFYTITHGF